MFINLIITWNKWRFFSMFCNYFGTLCLCLSPFMWEANALSPIAPISISLSHAVQRHFCFSALNSFSHDWYFGLASHFIEKQHLIILLIVNLRSKKTEKKNLKIKLLTFTAVRKKSHVVIITNSVFGPGYFIPYCISGPRTRLKAKTMIFAWFYRIFYDTFLFSTWKS